MIEDTMRSVKPYLEVLLPRYRVSGNTDLECHLQPLALASSSSLYPSSTSRLPPTQVLAYHGSLDIICHYPGAEDMFSRTSWTGHTQVRNIHPP